MLDEAIATACEGLIYMSETDAPVLPLSGSDAKEITDGPTQEISFDDFFQRLTEIKDWHGEREKERAKKFSELRKLLEENLRNLKVLRTGKIRINIYVVGTDINGHMMGVTTKAVET